MHKLSCIITDDEPFAAKGLKNYIEKIEFLELKGICESAIELNQLLQKEEVDVLFLDIQMPHLTGIEFLKSFKGKLPLVIFTTAHAAYALEGYELDILDYLLKPISFPRFLKAANKAKDFFELSHGKEETLNYFFIKSEKRLEKIRIEEIFFIESMQNYVTIYLENEKVMALITLKSVKDYLPKTSFIQPHRSFLVAIDKIKALEGNQIILPNSQQIPISKYQKEEVMSQIVNFQLSKK